MVQVLSTALTRSPVTLAKDFAGAAFIVVIVLAALSLPSLV